MTTSTLVAAVSLAVAMTGCIGWRTPRTAAMPAAYPDAAPKWRATYSLTTRYRRVGDDREHVTVVEPTPHDDRFPTPIAAAFLRTGWFASFLPGRGGEVHFDLQLGELQSQAVPAIAALFWAKGGVRHELRAAVASPRGSSASTSTATESVVVSLLVLPVFFVWPAWSNGSGTLDDLCGAVLAAAIHDGVLDANGPDGKGER